MKSMESLSFLESLNEDDLHPWFRSGAIIPQAQADEEIRQFLQSYDLIDVCEKHYVQCVNEDDGDYWDLQPDQRACKGKIHFQPGEERSKEYRCPECSRIIGTVEKETLRGKPNKAQFAEYLIAPNWWGVWEYVQERMSDLSPVTRVDRVQRGTIYDAFSTDITLKEGESLRLVLADRAEVEPLHKGLFFGTPGLYVQVDPNARRDVDLLQELQIVPFVQILVSSDEELSGIVQEAAIPIGNRTHFAALSQALEEQIEEKAKGYGGKEWQYFEQDLVPALANYISNNPEKTTKYLAKLKKLKGTLFSQYYVPVGGADSTDVQFIDKFGMITSLMKGNFIGEAKRYDEEATSKVDTTNIQAVSRHLLSSPSDAEGMIFFCTTNDVRSSVWKDVLQMKLKQGRWVLIIVTRYLLLEIIDAVEAHELLGVKRHDDGSLESIE